MGCGADNGGSLIWRDLGGVNGDFRCGKGTTFEGGHRPIIYPSFPSGFDTVLTWF